MAGRLSKLSIGEATSADAFSQRDQSNFAWHWYVTCLQIADILADPEPNGTARLALVCDPE